MKPHVVNLKAQRDKEARAAMQNPFKVFRNSNVSIRKQ